MNKKTITVALSLALLVSASAAVLAMEKGSGKGEADTSGQHAELADSASLNQCGLDRNGDGAITQQERRGNTTSSSQLDTNRDGVLTSADRAVRQKAPYVDRSGEVLWNGGDGWEASNWTRMDVNRNGVISRNEWRGTTLQFNHLDRNNDGVIAASETW